MECMPFFDSCHSLPMTDASAYQLLALGVHCWVLSGRDSSYLVPGWAWVNSHQLVSVHSRCLVGSCATFGEPVHGWWALGLSCGGVFLGVGLHFWCGTAVLRVVACLSC